MHIIKLTKDEANSFGHHLKHANTGVRVAIAEDGFKIAIGGDVWSPGIGEVQTSYTVDHNDNPAFADSLPITTTFTTQDLQDLRGEAWEEGYTAGLSDGHNDSNDERNPYVRYCESPYNPCPNQAETGRRLCSEHRKAFEKLLASTD